MLGAFEFELLAGALLIVLSGGVLVLAALRKARARREAASPKADTGLAEREGRPDGADAAAAAARVEKAERSRDTSALPRLYLALAQAQLVQGLGGEAAGNLRRSIRLSSELGQREVHAQARLELGDLARAEGDLTSACEHWQMARSLFHDLGNAKMLSAA